MARVRSGTAGQPSVAGVVGVSDAIAYGGEHQQAKDSNNERDDKQEKALFVSHHSHSSKVK